LTSARAAAARNIVRTKINFTNGMEEIFDL